MTIKHTNEEIHEELDDSEEDIQSEDVIITRRLQKSDQYKDKDIKAIAKKRNLSVEQNHDNQPPAPNRIKNLFLNGNVMASVLAAVFAIIAFFLISSFVTSKDFYNNIIINTAAIVEIKSRLDALSLKTDNFMAEKETKWKEHDAEYTKSQTDFLKEQARHESDDEKRFSSLENRLLTIEIGLKYEHIPTTAPTTDTQH